VLNVPEILAAVTLISVSAILALVALGIARVARIDRLLLRLGHARKPTPSPEEAASPRPLGRAA
jgi:hypothetical protein